MRPPAESDGPAVHDLIAACPGLDLNSLYCSVLQCVHFAGTSAVAESGGKIASWVSAFLLPGDPENLFVWQIAVRDSARGMGLGRALIRHVLSRPALGRVTRLSATITADNAASWALFRGLARELRAPFEHDGGFDRDIHFAGRHASELAVRIGPIPAATKD